jgi:hypothetical protein
MRMFLPALAMIALGAFCSQASAQTQCPELTRLRSEAAEGQRGRGLMSGRCEALIRTSIAWRAVLQYAEDNRQMCDVSVHSLADFEKYYSDAVSARDNVCAGRPVRPFPADIIQR